MNEVKQFDPNDIMKGVKDRIKATFVDMIPDEQWDAMIKKECDEFIYGRKNEYNSNRPFSEFKNIVQQALQDECKKRMADYLNGPEFESVWTEHGKPACCKAVKDMIVENSGAILISVFGGLFSDMLNRFRNDLLNVGRY